MPEYCGYKLLNSKVGQETIDFLAEKISEILFLQQFFEEKLLMCYHVLGQECVAYKVLNSIMESRKIS